MRFLCVGDLHIKVENLDIIDRAEDQICAWLENNTNFLDAVVILGDVLHTHERLHVLALNRAHDFFSRILKISNCPLYILVGNHDFIQNDQFLTSNHWMNAIKRWPNTYIADTVLSIENNGEIALFCPYVPNGRFEEMLLIYPNWRAASVIFAHQEFHGAEMNNGIISFNGDDWSCDKPYVISGHIHNRQDLACGIHYVGTILPSTNGISTISLVETFSQTTRKIEAITLFFPRKRILRNVSVEQIRDGVKEWKTSAIHGIVIRDTYDNFKLFQKENAFRELEDRSIRVTFKPLEQTHLITNEYTRYGFHEHLLNQVLKKENEFLYAALERIINDNTLEEDDILVVNRRFELK